MPISPEIKYRLVGAHWYAKGLYVKDEKFGNEIQARTLFQLREGDFVYNRLFAWKGSFAMATKEVDGCFVSNEFPCYALHDSIDPQFLWFYFSRPSRWKEALGLSSGSTPTSRNRLKEEQFLNMEVLLPPMDEQRRIVSRIRELATGIDESRRLRNEATEEAKAVLLSGWRLLFGAPEDNAWRSLCVEDCCEAIIDYRGRTPPLTDAGIPHLTSRNIKGGQIDWRTNKFVSDAIYKEYMTRGLPRPGDVIFTMEAPLGEAAVVPDERRFSLAQRTLLLRPKHNLVEGEFLAKVLMSPQIRERIRAKATGTTVKGIASKRLKSIHLPLPPIAEQKRMVAYLDSLQANVNALQQLQSETSAELDALMPSILSKAFRGEL